MTEKSFTGLLRMIMNKDDISRIMNYASDLLSSALVIVESSPQMNFYAMSTNRIPRDPYWAEAFKNGKCTEQLLERVFDSDFVITMSGKVQSGYSVNPDYKTLKYWCYFPLSDPYKNGLSIVALPDIDVFSEKQIDLLQSFINILSLSYIDVLQPSLIKSHPNRQDLYSAIRGIPVSISRQNSRSNNLIDDLTSTGTLESLDWNSVQLIVFQSNVVDRTHSTWQLMLDAIDDILLNHSATLSEGDIVALTHTLTPDILENLQAIANKYDLQIGISWPFSSRTEAPAHYKQAQYAIDVGIRIGSSSTLSNYSLSRIHLYDQFFHYKLIENNPIFDHWDAFRPEAIQVIQEYDNQHKTKLYETFHQYLLQNQRTTQTARILNVHKSTVQHRMETIHKLIGDIDLSAQSVTSLLMAYAIDTLM